MERPYRKKLGLLFLKPAGFGQRLALGTVAVSARVVGGVFKAAQLALLQVSTQGGGATLFDGLHDPAVRKGQAVSTAIVFTVLTKDMGQLALGSCHRLISDSQHVVGFRPLDRLYQVQKPDRGTARNDTPTAKRFRSTTL